MNRLEFLTYVTQTIKRTDKDTEVYQALNDTIKDIASRGQLHEYSFQAYTQTVVGQEDYTFPGDLLHIKHPIRLLEGNASGNTGWNLEKISKEKYDEYEPTPNRANPVCGRPLYYCIYANSILLTPIPDLVYLLEINYGNVPAELDNDTDESNLNVQWGEIVKFGVIMRMFELLGLYTDAAYWEKKYEVGVARMISNNKDKHGGVVSVGEVNNL